VNEFELIELIKKQLPTNSTVVAGAGDDCAVLDLGLPEKFLLFKTDAVVEGIHFNPSTEPERVGHKALGRCLSDVAAMAGQPTAALVTLALPPEFDVKWVEQFYAGMGALARRYEVAIVGGEVSVNPERKVISVSVIGTVAKEGGVRRSGARVGDAIFVTGELGGSLSGKHLDFEPRLAEGEWLASRFAIHAMIDLSDGLAGDLRHILRASGVGAELLSEAIPISRAAKLRAREGSARKPPLLAALSDGEDFELLFAVKPENVGKLPKRVDGVPITCIGVIKEESYGVKISEGARVWNLEPGGWEHFKDEG